MMPKPIVTTPSAYTYPLLIKQLLHTPLAVNPDQEIVYGERRHDYREFNARIHRLGNALRQLGVTDGMTVAVMDWDSHRYLESFFAVPMLGAVLQTVNIRLSPEQILYTLNHARADVLLVNAEFLPLLAQFRDQLQTVRQLILLADDTTAVPAGFAGEYESLLGAAAPDCDFPDFDENSRATTFYTTGTTGLPKGVYFSHRQIVLHTLAVTGALAIPVGQGSFRRGDVYMPLTPMFHVHAWGLPYVATLIGVKQVYPGRYQPDAILRLIERERVTFSHCVPTILHMLMNAPGIKDARLDGWKVIIGGSALPSALARAALARGIDLYTGYGMSETCPILTLAHLDAAALASDEETQLATRLKTGRPIPLVALRNVDGQMADCPHDGHSVGEVVVRAPWLTQGYLDNPVASEQLWENGWLHTQDIGHIDERGYLQVTDRIKDVIKTGGEWLSSLELEDLIGRHPAVLEVAVIGMPDAKWGERPMALVVLKPGQTASAEEIRQHVRALAEQGLVSRYAVPEQVQFLPQLPRTSVGKLNKKALRENYTGA